MKDMILKIRYVSILLFGVIKIWVVDKFDGGNLSFEEILNEIQLADWRNKNKKKLK